jgi:hypothetical protein
MFAGDYFGRRRALDITVTPESIRINGIKYLRRDGLNQFAIEEHERAFREAQAARNMNVSHIYRDSLQIVMRYGEKRVPIADFNRRDIRKAEALLVRLQGVTPNIEALLGASEEGAPAIDPGAADDFGRARAIR